MIELERALGIEISLTLINETPRFDQLCQALSERRSPGPTPLVTLKAGDGLPPLFFIHGVGGNLVEILPAARRVTYPGAVIGIRARGVVRGEVPHTSIEAMAEDYLRAIKERQPDGPYYLCGYSSGGLVAFEIARRLSESGDAVGLVGLFDTTMSPVRWPLRTWFSILARRMAFLAAALSTPVHTWPTTLRKSAERLRAWHGSPGAAPPIAIRVAASALIASAKYHPGFYRGQLTLFSPAQREPGLPSLESVWRNHARAVMVVETAGTHLTMLSPLHAETTAACVTRHLPAEVWPEQHSVVASGITVTRTRVVLIATDSWEQINGITTLYRAVIETLDQHFRGLCRLLVVHAADSPCDTPIGYGHRAVGVAPRIRFRVPQYPEILTGYISGAKFAKIERDHGNIDVVHVATQGLVGLSAARYAKRRRKRCVGFYHTHWPAYVSAYLPNAVPSAVRRPLGRMLAQRWDHLVYGRCSPIVVHTARSEQWLPATLKGRIVRASEFVDCRRFDAEDGTADRDRTPGQVVFGFVGRIAREKNLPSILRHADRIRDLGCRLLIVGDGPERSNLSCHDAAFVGWKGGRELVAMYKGMHFLLLPAEVRHAGVGAARSCGLWNSGRGFARYGCCGLHRSIRERRRRRCVQRRALWRAARARPVRAFQHNACPGKSHGSRPRHPARNVDIASRVVRRNLTSAAISCGGGRSRA